MDNEVILVEVDGEQLSPEHAAQKLREKRAQVLQDMLEMRNRWIEHRRNSGVEARWKKARQLYFGFDLEASKNEMEETLKNGPSKRSRATPQRSRVKINIIRPKVDQAVSRHCEIMLPTDGQNFGLDPTPVADAVSSMFGSSAPTIDPRTGAPTGFTADIEAKAITEAAAESVSRHEKVIADQLAECDYNAQLRMAFEDHACLGTMIIEGPIPRAVQRKRWVMGSDGRMRKHVETVIQPVSYRRDLWDVWFSPDCGNDHQRGGGYWVRIMVSRKELRALRGQPGFSRKDIDEILKETPKRAVAEQRVRQKITQDSSYELFVYHGEIEPSEYQKACCIDINPDHEDNESDDFEAGENEALEDEEVSFGLVMICNDRLVGAMPSWRDDGKLPISVSPYRATDDSPYGLGIPDEQEDQQAVVNAAWRQLMDHGRYTVGVQFVRKKKGVNPAVNPADLTPTPNRMWDASDDIDDVRKALAAIDVPSHLNDYLNIVKAAMEYADTESNMPQLLAGSANGNAHETLGGMIMLFNNATTTLRHRVRRIDDDITTSQINGYYDWNMEFHPDPMIKAEAKVIPRGSTVLLEKDIQNQMTLQLMALLQNPRYSKFLDAEKELDVILRAARMRPEQIKASVSQIEEAKKNPEQPPPDPRIVSAQLGFEAKKMEIADNQQQREFEAGRNEAELNFRAQNLAYNSRREDMEYAIAMNDQAIKRDVAVMKASNDANLTREGIISKERLKALEIDAANQRFNAESALRVSTGQGI